MMDGRAMSNNNNNNNNNNRGAAWPGPAPDAVFFFAASPPELSLFFLTKVFYIHVGSFYCSERVARERALHA
jgi:hypothetical protein